MCVGECRHISKNFTTGCHTQYSLYGFSQGTLYGRHFRWRKLPNGSSSSSYYVLHTFIPKIVWMRAVYMSLRIKYQEQQHKLVYIIHNYSIAHIAVHCFNSSIPYEYKLHVYGKYPSISELYIYLVVPCNLRLDEFIDTRK